MGVQVHQQLQDSILRYLDTWHNRLGIYILDGTDLCQAYLCQPGTELLSEQDC